MADRWDRIKSVFLDLVGRKPSVSAALLAEAWTGDEELRQQVESPHVADQRATPFLERPGVDVIHGLPGAPPSCASTVIPTQEKLQLITTWVRGALQRLAPARRGWLESITRDHEELLSEAETLLSIATRFTNGELEAAAESGKGVPSCMGQDRERTPVLGQRLAHYDLVSWLGAGGMGEVFRARDTALGRDAALKLIPRRFTPAMRLRLLREAEASAKLQHPAIATFYEAGEDAGEAFIAMEFVEGMTLRKRLANGPIALDQALAITRCLLEALQHAHTAGILHRDIKPENIVVTGPHAVKLLDFGLAMHLLAPEVQSPLAPDGGVAYATSSRVTGTLGYMAPEQLRCDALDARTDVFQVGVVLYELLTGSPAFPGSTPLERIAAVMLSDPDFNVPTLSGLPAAVRHMLQCALSREPAGRYPTAAAFLADLEDLAGRAQLDRSLTIAVLDLEDLTLEDETAWVGIAVAEALRASLSGAPTLTVIPRERVLAATQAAATSDRGAGPVGVGLQLGCDRVVSGSYRSAGTNLEISLRLDDVSTGRLASKQDVEGSINQVIELEHLLRDRLLESLSLASPESPRQGPTSVEAHECFARARRLLDGLNKGAIDQARDLLNRAVTLEPHYAAALAALANAYGFRSIATTDATDLARAIEFANRAINSDAGNSEAYTWKGYSLMRQGRFEEAAAAYSRAMKLDPTHAPAPYFAGSSLLFAGRIADALPLLQRAVDLDPRLGMPWLGLGASHLSLSHLREARYCFERARALEDEAIRFETTGADAYIADVLRVEGHLDDARRRVLTGLESVERSDHAYRDTFRAYALVVLGQTALDQRDVEGARAAFGQVLAQAQGRPRTRSCGQLVVRATVGLAAASSSVQLYEQAAHLYAQRNTYNFEPFFGALDHQALFEIARVAQILGRHNEAIAFLERGRKVGETRTLSPM